MYWYLKHTSPVNGKAHQMDAINGPEPEHITNIQTKREQDLYEDLLANEYY